MSGGPELALGRSADQRGLEIEGILERGVRVWERPLRVEHPCWGPGRQADVSIRFREADIRNGRDEPQAVGYGRPPIRSWVCKGHSGRTFMDRPRTTRR